MSVPDLEDALIAWGRVYGMGRMDLIEDRSLTGNSTLARFGKPKQGDVVRRDGRSRRMAMGGGRLAPMWAVDPIPCTETRTLHRPDYDPRETPVVGLIQTGWLALHRTSRPLAEAVRLHYQRRDVDRDRRAKLAGMTVREYRDCLSRGRAYLAAFMGG